MFYNKVENKCLGNDFRRDFFNISIITKVSRLLHHLRFAKLVVGPIIELFCTYNCIQLAVKMLFWLNQNKGLNSRFIQSSGSGLGLFEHHGLWVGLRLCVIPKRMKNEPGVHVLIATLQHQDEKVHWEIKVLKQMEANWSCRGFQAECDNDTVLLNVLFPLVCGTEWQFVTASSKVQSVTLWACTPAVKVHSLHVVRNTHMGKWIKPSS